MYSLLCSECKMGSYQEQLCCLKKHIGDLQEDFGEFENLNELHDMVSLTVNNNMYAYAH